MVLAPSSKTRAEKARNKFLKKGLDIIKAKTVVVDYDAPWSEKYEFVLERMWVPLSASVWLQSDGTFA